jgi:DNA-binding FadR family transcriptional regulator
MRKGKRGRVDDLPPGSGHAEVARVLRRAVIDGEFDGKGQLTPGPQLAGRLGVSLATVQQAVAILAREGLLAVVSRQRTLVPSRRHWLVDLSLPPEDDGTGIAGAAVRHVAVQRIETEPGMVRLTVVSANWGGAASVVASVAGALPVRFVTVREA